MIKDFAQAIDTKTRDRRSGFLNMLLRMLGENFLGNMLVGKGVIRAGDGVQRAAQDFQCHLIFWLILKYKGITTTNSNSQVFIYGIVSQKIAKSYEGWRLRNKSWWVQINRNTLFDGTVIFKFRMEEDYAWNRSTCACECNKDCKIGEYLIAHNTRKYINQF